MVINFVPGKRGWITMDIGPDPDNVCQIQLSYITDSWKRLHRFFFHLANDKSGLSAAEIDEEGRFAKLRATPAKKPAHLKFAIKQQDDELEFFCRRHDVVRSYCAAFRELVDEGDLGGFRLEVLYVSEFEALLGNH